jgi:hypothetical protein
MSAWRRTALEALPDFRVLIERASSPMALWIDLLAEFKDGFSRDDSSLVAKVLGYARWCWRSSDGDTVNAVACAFYEHLPDHGGMRRAIPQWFTKEEFEELRSVFECRAGAEVVSDIEKDYRFARG